jgi:hypothetical protein
MSETRVYDVPEVLAALEAAVAKRGADYVYEDEYGVRLGARDGDGNSLADECRYVHNRDTAKATPGCIVGQVFYDLTGRLVPAGVEHTTPRGPAFEDLGLFTRPAREVLARVQMLQDDGNTWGRALAVTKARLYEVSSG